MPISDTPWSQIDKPGDYTPAQWRRACLVDTGEGDQDNYGRYKLPVREPDGTLNRNGVHAAVGGHGIGAVQGISPEQRRAVARKLVSLYRDELEEEPPEGLLRLAGSSAERMQPMPPLYMRSVPLEDIRIRAGGDGRTVEAYAAVFDIEAEVRDPDGHYMETNDPVMFMRTLSHARSSSYWGVGVFYNHGKTLWGTPSERGSVPLGTPLEIRADKRGLLTITRYGRTPLADEVLEMIHEGAIRGQSYTGQYLRSNPKFPPRGGYRPDRTGNLTKVRRLESTLKEYGPTPYPVFAEAAIVGVRAAGAHTMSPGTPYGDPPDTDLGHSDLDPPGDRGTPYRGLATEDPRAPLSAHSARSAVAWARTRADIRSRVGVRRGKEEEV